MKKLAVVIVVVVLLAVYGILALDYMRQGSEQDRLLSEIEEIDQSLQDVSEPPLNYLEELALIEATLAAEQEMIPSYIGSTDVIETILNVAQMTGVKAIPLITEPWSKENIGEGTYLVFRISLGVEGTFAQISAFISYLENSEFNTLSMEQLSIVVDDEEGEVYSGEETSVIVEMDLFVLAQYLTN